MIECAAANDELVDGSSKRWSAPSTADDPKSCNLLLKGKYGLMCTGTIY